MYASSSLSSSISSFVGSLNKWVVNTVHKHAAKYVYDGKSQNVVYLYDTWHGVARMTFLVAL